MIGQVTVPLLHLITKNSGIDGDFVIFDEHKQQMGTLRLRISLNHHSQQRPLYSNEQASFKGKPRRTEDLDKRATIIDRSLQYHSLARTNNGLINRIDS